MLEFNNESRYSDFSDQNPVDSEVLIDDSNLANLNDYNQLAFIPDPCNRDTLMIHDVINDSLPYCLGYTKHKCFIFILQYFLNRRDFM